MINTPHELLLVRLLGDKVAVFETVGVATKDINPLLVFTRPDGVRLG